MAAQSVSNGTNRNCMRISAAFSVLKQTWAVKQTWIEPLLMPWPWALPNNRGKGTCYGPLYRMHVWCFVALTAAGPKVAGTGDPYVDWALLRINAHTKMKQLQRNYAHPVEEPRTAVAAVHANMHSFAGGGTLGRCGLQPSVTCFWVATGVC
eukprot:354212-Chlamydomonas_euryale.AAC.10